MNVDKSPASIPWAALVVALALRLAWGSLLPEDPLRGDQATYVALAKSIASGQGYVAFGQPHTHYLPGWPLALAIPFSLGMGMGAARVLLYLLSMLVCLEAYLLGRRLASQRAGTMAAWITAIFPPLVWYSRILAIETAAAAVLGAWAIAALDYVQGGSRRGLPLVLIGLSALLPVVRAELIVVVPLPYLVRAFARSPRRELCPAVATGLAVVVGLAPWWLYNKRRFGEIIPLSTAGGLGLWASTFKPAITDFDSPEFRAGAARLTVAGRPRTTDERYATEARTRIGADPWLYIHGRMANAPRFWLGSHSEAVPSAGATLDTALRQGDRWALGIKLVGFGSQALLAMAAVAGGFISIRQGAPLFLWLVIAAKFAAHAPFVQAPRFSLHLAPILCAYAAIALVGLIDRRLRSGPSSARGSS